MKYKYEVEISTKEQVEKLTELYDENCGKIKPLNKESKKAFEDLLEDEEPEEIKSTGGCTSVEVDF